jgi:hypothetical protein
MTALRAGACQCPKAARERGRSAWAWRRALTGAEHSDILNGVMAGLLIVDEDGVHPQQSDPVIGDQTCVAIRVHIRVMIGMRIGVVISAKSAPCSVDQIPS